MDGNADLRTLKFALGLLAPPGVVALAERAGIFGLRTAGYEVVHTQLDAH